MPVPLVLLTTVLILSGCGDISTPQTTEPPQIQAPEEFSGSHHHHSRSEAGQEARDQRREEHRNAGTEGRTESPTDVRPDGHPEGQTDGRAEPRHQDRTDGRSQTSAAVPAYALETLHYVQQHGRSPEGYEGGRVFTNYEGRLPARDESGQSVRYQEWDVHPHEAHVNRGAERLVTGSDGSAWFSNDHYQNFTRVRE